VHSERLSENNPAERTSRFARDLVTQELGLLVYLTLRHSRNSTCADIIEAVRRLVLIASDDLIAGLLNNGLKTGNGNRWTRERVTSMRSNYRIPVFKPAEDGIEPWLNLASAAKLLKIA